MSVLRVPTAVAKVTFREVLHDRVLYNILVFTVILFVVALLASQVTFLRPDRVILDFGVAAVNLGCSALAVLIGAGQINRELERRTIYVTLAHPISRLQFVIGKWFGLVLVIALNWFLMSVVDVGSLLATSGMANVHPTLFEGLFLLFLQAVTVSSIAILFSCLSTTSVAVILTFCFYIVGTNISQIRLIADRQPDLLFNQLMKKASYVLPNLEYFQLGTKITYGIPISPSFVLLAIGYTAIVAALCMALAGVALDRREI